MIYAVQFDQKPKIADALKLPIEPSKTISELKPYNQLTGKHSSRRQTLAD